MHTSYWRLAGLFSRPAPLTMPLDYPDPHDEFYGYTRRLTHLPGGELARDTRPDARRRLDGHHATGVPGGAVCGDQTRLRHDVSRAYRRRMGHSAG